LVFSCQVHGFSAKFCAFCQHKTIGEKLPTWRNSVQNPQITSWVCATVLHWQFFANSLPQTLQKLCTLCTKLGRQATNLAEGHELGRNLKNPSTSFLLWIIQNFLPKHKPILNTTQENVSFKTPHSEKNVFHFTSRVKNLHFI
jgi:hypothetical protein